MIDNLFNQLTAIVGPTGIVTGDDLRARPASWTRSGEPCAAAVLVRPRDTAETSAVMAACHGAGRPMVPRGGCTGLVDGVLCAPGEVALSLERMVGLEMLDPLAAAVTVKAGTTLEAVQTATAAEGLMFPLDLGARGSATVGGAISTNAGGLRVLRYGMMRDMVLGLEAVLADGTVLSSMRPLIKNNTGLDLKQLFIGTEGTLGVVTRAVLRLRPAPAGLATAFLACPGVEAAGRVLALAQARFGGRVSSFEGMWPHFYTFMTEPGRFAPPLGRDHPFYALIEIECTEAERPAFRDLMEEAFAAELVLDAALASSEEQRRALWRIREDVNLLGASGFDRGFDVSVPLPFLHDYVEGVMSAVATVRPGTRAIAFGHIGDNNVHWSMPRLGSADLDAAVDLAVYEPLASVGGSISAEHGIGLEKRKHLGLSRSPAELAIMRAVKRAVDPQLLLNPGKIL